MNSTTQFIDLLHRLSRHQVYLISGLTEQGVQRVQVPPQILQDQEAQAVPSKRLCPPSPLHIFRPSQSPVGLMSLRKRRESFWQLCFGAIMRNYKCDTYLKTQSKRRLSLPHCNLTSFFVWQKTTQISARNSKIMHKCDTYLKTRSKRRSGEMQTELESS